MAERQPDRLPRERTRSSSSDAPAPAPPSPTAAVSAAADACDAERRRRRHALARAAALHGLPALQRRNSLGALEPAPAPALRPFPRSSSDMRWVVAFVCLSAEWMMMMMMMVMMMVVGDDDDDDADKNVRQ